MFPGCDARGRTRGFGARAMRENQRPKYLNTSDGVVYHKRSQLFGIDLARRSGRPRGRMILVEGYTDVLALHQAGLRNAVGIMGTALTEEQVGELKRIVQVLDLASMPTGLARRRCCAPPAAAGRRARAPGRPAARRTDPAELLMREGGPEELRERIGRPFRSSSFHVERILERADTRSAEAAPSARGAPARRWPSCRAARCARS